MTSKDDHITAKCAEFERFIAKNSFREFEDNCWIWIGSVHPRWKYPYQHWNGIRSYIHRLVYTHLKGPLGRGDLVRRSCGQSLCVNPDHLVRQRTENGACTLSGQARNYPKPANDKVGGFDWAAFYGGFEKR